MKPRISPVVTLFVALALSLLQACTSIRHIREAQDAFNDAARAELDLHVSGSDAGAPTLIGAPAATGYKVALGLVDRELADNSADLEGDDLMGTALMLRALCIWRLSDVDGLEAEQQGSSSAKKKPSKKFANLSEALGRIEQYGVEKLATRDRVLYYALPGLRDHDRALRAKSWESANKLFASAIEVTDRALEKVQPPEDHPIRAYIALAQLSTCRAWQAAAIRSTDNETQGMERAAAARAAFEKKLEAARPLWHDDEQFFAQIKTLCKAMGMTPPAHR